MGAYLDPVNSVLSLDAVSSPPTPTSGMGFIYYDSGSGQIRMSQNGGAASAVATASTITLQSAYDAGQSISTTSAVVLTGSAANNNDVLQVNKTPAGAQTGNGIVVTMGSNATGVAAVFSGTASNAIVHIGNGVTAAAPTGGALRGTSASAVATAGGGLTIQAGAGNTTGQGGTTTVQGGAAGATGTGGTTVVRGGAGGGTSGPGGTAFLLGGIPTDGLGGSVQVSGAAGVGANRSGGVAAITGGDATGTATGGAVNLAGGSGGDTGTAGAVLIVGGDGGATSGSGGTVTLRGGAAVAGNSVGGAATVQGGAAQGTATGGVVNLTGGTGGPTSGAGGNAVISGGVSGAAAGTGGDIVFQTARATAGTTLVERVRIGADGGQSNTGVTTANAPSVSAASAGKLYFNSTQQRYLISENTAAYRLLAPFQQNAASNSTITTTSTTDVLATGMTITPEAGTYIVWFSSSAGNSAGTSTVTASIYSGGVQVTGTERQIGPGGNQWGGARLPFSCCAVTTVNGAQAIEGRWRVSSGTGSMLHRTIVIMRIA